MNFVCGAGGGGCLNNLKEERHREVLVLPKFFLFVCFKPSNNFLKKTQEIQADWPNNKIFFSNLLFTFYFGLIY